MENFKGISYDNSRTNRTPHTEPCCNLVPETTGLRLSLYTLLRYGVKVKEDVGENTQTIMLIDWKNPEKNHFAIAEEVTIRGENKKRPDVVLYGAIETPEKYYLASKEESSIENLLDRHILQLKPRRKACANARGALSGMRREAVRALSWSGWQNGYARISKIQEC